MRDPDSEVINNNPLIINRCSKIATKKTHLPGFYRFIFQSQGLPRNLNCQKNMINRYRIMRLRGRDRIDYNGTAQTLINCQG